MVTTNEALRDAAIRHRIWTIKHETHTYNQLLVNFLNDMDADLTKGIDKRVRALKPGKPESFEIRKFKKLQTFVRESVKEQTSLLNKDMSEELKKLAEYEAEWQATSLARELLVDYDVVTPTPATLRSIITERPLQGHLLNDWTSQWGASKVNRVTGSLRLGLAQGQTAEEIVRAITGTKARNYQDGILDISRRGARMLVRTTSNDVMTKARESVYKENSDLLKGIGWLSTLDSRTTPICRARDGIVYPVNEGPRPPAHANCRSTTYPVTKSFRELGFDLDEFPKGDRPSVVDGMAGDVPATETYQTWLSKQSFKFQDQVLGQSRAKLFREGDMKLTQFVDDIDGRQYTLAELKIREPDIWDTVFSQDDLLFEPDGTLNLLAVENPYREGTPGYAGFEAFRKGASEGKSRAEIKQMMVDAGLAPATANTRLSRMYKQFDVDTGRVIKAEPVTKAVKSTAATTAPKVTPKVDVDVPGTGAFDKTKVHKFVSIADDDIQHVSTIISNPNIASAALDKPSYYSASTKTIFLREGADRASLSHEYGHHLDYMIAPKGLKQASAAQDVLESLEKDKSRLIEVFKFKPKGSKVRPGSEISLNRMRELNTLKEPSSKVEYLDDLFKRNNLPFTAQDFIDDASSNMVDKYADVYHLAARYVTAIEQKDVSIVLDAIDDIIGVSDSRNINDYFGAVTGNVIGRGHTNAYYIKKGASATRLGAGNSSEAFANYVALSGNKVAVVMMERTAPNTVKAFRRNIANFLESKGKTSVAGSQIVAGRPVEVAAKKVAASATTVEKVATKLTRAEKRAIRKAQAVEIEKDVPKKDIKDLTRPTGKVSAIAENKAPDVTESVKEGLVYTQEPMIERISKARGMSVAEYKKAIDAELERLTKDSDVYSRVSPATLNKIIKEGRFKNQHETLKSGGFYSPEKRASFENSVWQLGNRTEKQYPIYGYLSDNGVGVGKTAVAWSEKKGLELRVPLDQYGTVQVKFKKSVRSRSTWMDGDSLNFVHNNGGVAMTSPVPLNKPTYKALNYNNYTYDKIDPLDKLRSAKTIDELYSGLSYNEVQVFDGLNLADIDEVIFQEQKPLERFQSKLNKLGIKASYRDPYTTASQ